MAYNREEMLIDHLDKTLEGSALPEAAELIRTDKSAAAEWQYLNLALDAILEAGLQEQVATVKQEWLAEQSKRSRPAVVRTLYRNALRIAACVILLAGAVTIYKYASTNAVGIYDQYYSSFDLNTSRGAGNADELEQAYRDKNWAAVIARFNGLKDKNNKSRFLTGMANLELKNYDAAIGSFKQVLDENARTGDNYFQDEAEYYLALGYLATRQTGKALPLLKKIKADPAHLYHKKVSDMSWLDLKIAGYKDTK